MASERTFSTSDLRSAAQDSKRSATRKHKWQLGSVQRVGGAPNHPRPSHPSETYFNARRRDAKGAVASLAHGTKIARKHDIRESTANAVSDDSSSNSSSDHDDSHKASSSPPSETEIMYSFDAARGPSRGSEILNVALAKAVEKFEERETAKLVKNEYDVIDSEGESVGLSSTGKRGKGKGKALSVPLVDEDEDYEFV
ncbi:hypothetical protein BDY17DRAFT_320187 [Neohortaea acidophila]|uniref:Uncharacterized protein n=1 Tax=Neohortaea acidophila TaxID=245834 RepID=A0A6A6Q5U6_9PEZI|nr:uncharacterized protein BDY17DRAFT_320187 [Neohortaea acidophila]KAF2487662.1 hypothetical protein BDY17DRAFT_320187 [Neohortaea acidophila]